MSTSVAMERCRLCARILSSPSPARCPSSAAWVIGAPLDLLMADLDMPELGRGCLLATPCRTRSGTAASAPAWPSHRALVGASESFPELPGSRQSPLLSSLRAHPEPGPLSSPGITRVLRSYGPLRLLSGPLPAEALPRWQPDRSPVLQIAACAYVLRPLPRRAGRPSSVGASGRLRRPSSFFGGLGARIGCFEACSGFTHVAARTLADPSWTGLCPRGFDGTVTLPPPE